LTKILAPFAKPHIYVIWLAVSSLLFVASYYIDPYVFGFCILGSLWVCGALIWVWHFGGVRPSRLLSSPGSFPITLPPYSNVLTCYGLCWLLPDHPACCHTWVRSKQRPHVGQVSLDSVSSPSKHGD